jgi:hypothetical protein
MVLAMQSKREVAEWRSEEARSPRIPQPGWVLPLWSGYKLKGRQARTSQPAKLPKNDVIYGSFFLHFLKYQKNNSRGNALFFT